MGKKSIIRWVVLVLVGVGAYFGIRYGMYLSILSEERQKAEISSPAQKFDKDRVVNFSNEATGL